MVGIENTRTLYVNDGLSGFIWKIDVDNNKIDMWLPISCDGLPIAGDSNLLVLQRFTDLLLLETYNQEGKLVRSVSLPEHFRHPFNSLQKTKEEFIVIHSLKESSGKFVSFISVDVKIIRQFKLKAVFSSSHVQLFLDAHNNNLIVAELIKGEIHLFNLDSLSWNHTYQFQGRFLLLTNVFHDIKKKQLIVALYSAAQILTLTKN